MNDPEHEHDAILLDDVVHDPVIPDLQQVEGVRDTPDRLHGLATDPPGLRYLASNAEPEGRQER